MLAQVQGKESVNKLQTRISDSAVRCGWPLPTMWEMTNAKPIDIKPEHYRVVLQTAMGYVAELMGSSIAVKQLHKINRSFTHKGVEIRDLSTSVEKIMS